MVFISLFFTNMINCQVLRYKMEKMLPHEPSLVILTVH